MAASSRLLLEHPSFGPESKAEEREGGQLLSDIYRKLSRFQNKRRLHVEDVTT